LVHYLFFIATVNMSRSKRRFDGINLIDNLTTIGDILPDSDALYNIGSSTKRFKDATFSGTGTMPTLAGNTTLSGNNTHSGANTFSSTNRITTGTNGLLFGDAVVNADKTTRLGASERSGTTNFAYSIIVAATGSNSLRWGGSSGGLNAATDHQFYAASTTGTATGTKMATIDINGLTINAGGFRGRTVTLTGTTSLDVTHSDANIQLQMAASAYTVTIPAPASVAGAIYRFSMNSITAAHDVTINCATSAVTGYLVVNGSVVQGQYLNNLKFVSGSTATGDYIHIHSDGLNWNVVGFGKAAGSLTFT
jgi:hypothetical protein